MINLEAPKKFRPLVGQAHQVARNLLRPNSRKYDLLEHEYPKELDMLAAMVDGLSQSGAASGAGASGVRRTEEEAHEGVKNGSNLASVLSVMEMC
jgi:acyl-CoA dehydrogenase